MGNVRRTISRGNDVSDLTIMVRAKNKEEAQILKKEIQKTVRNCNHLLKKKIKYELITIQH